MKKLMITGGLLGFVIGISFGLLQQSGWPSILWRASVAAFGSGLLMRWWGRIWVRSLQQAYQDRRAAESATEQPAVVTAAASKPS
jgi:hypothetical protein